MTGKRYYITTLAGWRHHAARFANSHWLALDSHAPNKNVVIPSEFATTDDEGSAVGLLPGGEKQIPSIDQTTIGARNDSVSAGDAEPSMRILALIEADEGVHLALEDDPAFEPLPHPLAQKPISDSAQSALAAHGVAPDATTFDAAETLARFHPLLRHRVF
jgi:hypothetical protein